MNHRLYRLIMVVPLLCLWIGVALPVAAAPLVKVPFAPQPDRGPAAQTVDRCPNFTPFDAAAVLQEPVNAEAPIGNLLFGPLPADFVGEESGLQGFCGYASALPSDGAIELDQTHMATQLATAHAVVADRLSADVIPAANGTVLTDWVDLYALAEVVGAANPDHDSDAVFDTLYNFAGHFPLLEILYADASAAPSFTVTMLPLAKDDPRDELLWLWQTLDDGYFSLLISRQDLAFDLVAARLGSQVQDQTVLGYSRVILDKLTATQSTDGKTTGAADGIPGCDRLTLAEVAAIVGEPVQGQAVSNAQGDGCKYTPVADEVAVDTSDFSNRFQTQGLLVGLVPPPAAQELLSEMITELASTGEVTDGLALGELLAAVEDEAWGDALEQMALMDWGSGQWQVEALTAISADTLFISGTAGNGWPKIFVLRPDPEGGLYYMTGEVHQELDDIYGAIIAAARQLSTAEHGHVTAEEAPAAEADPSSGDEVATDECAWLTVAEVAALLGEPVQMQAVASERGAGCKYFPQAEEAWVAPDDFSPAFESQGVLAGLMPIDGAQWLLSELVEVLQAQRGASAKAPLAALQASVEAGEIKAALQQLATLEGAAGEWQVAALPTVSDTAIVMYSDEDGYRLAFFFRSASDGSMATIAVQLPSDRADAAMQETIAEMLRNLGE